MKGRRKEEGRKEGREGKEGGRKEDRGREEGKGTLKPGAEAFSSPVLNFISTPTGKSQS